MLGRGLLAILLCGGGCGAQFKDQVYRAGAIAYRVGALPPEWRRVSVERGLLAFHHRSGGAIAAGATCGREDDVPLEILTNHLLIGFDDRREVASRRFTLDGRAALATDLDATIDGVGVSLALVIVKRDGCTYDLQLVAPPPAFTSRRADFERFVDGFHQLRAD